MQYAEKTSDKHINLTSHRDMVIPFPRDDSNGFALDW
jgi:hypothetical protein